MRTACRTACASPSATRKPTGSSSPPCAISCKAGPPIKAGPMPERLGPPRSEPMFERLVIVGLGLIGSSLARAARHINLARTIVAVDQVEPHLPQGVHFVPAHPVAGTEYSGPDAGFTTLFFNKWCILTPSEGTD